MLLHDNCISDSSGITCESRLPQIYWPTGTSTAFNKCLARRVIECSRPTQKPVAVRRLTKCRWFLTLACCDLSGWKTAGCCRSLSTLSLTETTGLASGGISLRDAIAAATPGETIDFSVTGTILLTHGELLINKSLTIHGPGVNSLTIDASGNDGHGSRMFDVDDGSFGNTSAVAITGLTLTGADTSDPGGADFNKETLSIADSVITGNSTSLHGGGIYNGIFGDLTLTRTTISNNSGHDGGGIPNQGN